MTRINIITKLLVSLAVFYYVFDYFTVPTFLYVAVTAAVATAAVVSLRATMVIWVTVLVMLSFAGNRRKSLVKREDPVDVLVEYVKYFLETGVDSETVLSNIRNRPSIHDYPSQNKRKINQKKNLSGEGTFETTPPTAAKKVKLP
ncbi:hypothetical protein RYX36_026319 [Vicia faba]